MQVMDGVRELEAFSAVVYSSNFGVGGDGEYVVRGDVDVATAVTAEKMAGVDGDDNRIEQVEPIAPTSIGVVSGMLGMVGSVWNRVSGLI